MAENRTRQGIMVERVTSDYYAPYASAIGEAPNGHAYLICTEGVGRMVNTSPDDETIYKPTGETIDLTDWIRQFGARLESNYRLWARTLTATDHADCHPDQCPDSPYNDPNKLCPDCTGQGCDTCDYIGLRED